MKLKAIRGKRGSYYWGKKVRSVSCWLILIPSSAVFETRVYIGIGEGIAGVIFAIIYIIALVKVSEQEAEEEIRYTKGEEKGGEWGKRSEGKRRGTK